MTPEGWIPCYFCFVWLTICRLEGGICKGGKTPRETLEVQPRPCPGRAVLASPGPCSLRDAEFRLWGLCCSLWTPEWELRGAGQDAGMGGRLEEANSAGVPQHPASSQPAGTTSTGKTVGSRWRNTPQGRAAHTLSPCRPQPQILPSSLSLLITRDESPYCLIITWLLCTSSHCIYFVLAINSKVLAAPEMERGGGDFLRSSTEELPLKNGEIHVSMGVGVSIGATC